MDKLNKKRRGERTQCDSERERPRGLDMSRKVGNVVFPAFFSFPRYGLGPGGYVVVVGA